MDRTARLAAVEAAFDTNFARGAELGAAVAVWHRGGLRLERCGGPRTRDAAEAWTLDTLAPVYSAGKGPAAFAVWEAAHANHLDGDTEVRRVWPKLRAARARPITLGDLLSHQCGLAVLDQSADVADHAAVVAALERQDPAWHPPAHGYHPRTFGAICEELARRITGVESLGQWWRELAAPAGIDFWFGVPEFEDARVAMVFPGKPQQRPAEAAFYQEFARPDSEVRRAFQSPTGLNAINDMNKVEARRLGQPGFGGFGSASGLATFYGLLAEGALGHEKSRRELRTRRVDGDDRILRARTSFSGGCMLDPISSTGKLRHHFGPHPDAFGHPGAGGGHAFADPGEGIGFAYVPNQFELGIFPGPRSLRMVAALYGMEFPEDALEREATER